LHLAFRLFGHFDVRRNALPVEIASRHTQSLLAYLLLNPHIRHRRERIAGIFWPDSDVQNARAYLRQALWQLRKSLGDEFLLTDKLEIGINPSAEYSLDVATLTKPISEDISVEDLIRIVSVYKNELLPGFYDDWVIIERERLKLIFQERIQLLLDKLYDQGHWQDMLTWGERWISLVQAPEPAYRALMKAHSALGDGSSIAKVYNRCVQDLDRELSVAPNSATHSLYARLTGEEWLPTKRNPYRGLFAFREKDAPYFFGRETFTSLLAEKVRTESLVALSGPSGSGKSSVVYAGLIPHLRSEGGWRIVGCRPGSEPFQSLAITILPLVEPPRSPASAAKLADSLRRGEIKLADLLMESPVEQREGDRTLLVVDQLEELYALCPDEKDRQRFLDLLLEFDSAQRLLLSPRFTILLVLRADFLGEALAYRLLTDALQSATLFLGPMGREELNRAITHPARKAGAAFEAGLAKRILDDVGEQMGNLPLLEFALTQLWERHSKDLLHHEAYDSIGKVGGALACHADLVFSNLSRQEQEISSRVFVQLVRPDLRTADTRRIALRSELDVEEWKLVHKLADARLVVAGRDSTGAETVELVHETLITAWSRLNGWLEANRAFRTWQEHLRTNIRQWKVNGQDKDALLRGAPLAEAQRWFEEHREDISSSEMKFIQASLDSHSHQQMEQKKMRRRIRSGLVAGMLVMIILALITTLFWRRALRGEDAALEAYSLSLAANAKQLLEAKENTSALAVALAANQADHPPAQAQRYLREAAFAPGARRLFDVNEFGEGYGPFAVSVAISPDGRTALASASSDGTLILFDMSTGDVIRRFAGHTTYAEDIAFSPDGKRALSGSSDNTVILWNVATGQPLQRFTSHPGWVNTVDFSYDGRWALSAGLAGGDIVEAVGKPGVLILWDIEGGSEIRRFEGGHAQVIIDAKFSPDGSKILSSSGLRKAATMLSTQSSLVLWDAFTGDVLLKSEGLIQNPTRLAFSPDGRTALVGSMEGDMHLLDLSSGEILHTFGSHSDWVSDVTFSPDGRLAIAATGDGEIVIWNLITKERLANFRIHTGEVIQLVVGPGGRQVLSTSIDGTLILWDLLDASELRRFWGHKASLTSLDFAPDGKRFISSALDSSLRLWDLATGEQVWISPEQSTSPLSAAVSPDGRTALYGLEDGRVCQLVVETGRLIRCLEKHAGAVNRVVYHPNGRTAFSVSSDMTIVEWDITTGDTLRYLLGHTASVFDFAITPDGRLGLSGALDGLILWDLETGGRIRQFYGDQGYQLTVSGVALTSNGRLALSGGGPLNNLVSVWEVATGDDLARFDEDDPVLDVAISPDGRWGLYSAAGSGLNHIDLEMGQIIRTLHGHDAAIRSLVFNPDGQTALSGGEDTNIIEWNIENYSLEELFDWIVRNRYVRELTCAERVLYAVEPLCEERVDAPNPLSRRALTMQDVSATSTPHPMHHVLIGENRGQIQPGDFDVWSYHGKASEMISIYVNADQPANLNGLDLAYERGLLDVALLVIAPDGGLLTANVIDGASETFTTNAALRDLTLPVDGLYRFQVTTAGLNTGGPYTLIIESSFNP